MFTKILQQTPELSIKHQYSPSDGNIHQYFKKVSEFSKPLTITQLSTTIHHQTPKFTIRWQHSSTFSKPLTITQLTSNIRHQTPTFTTQTQHQHTNIFWGKSQDSLLNTITHYKTLTKTNWLLRKHETSLKDEILITNCLAFSSKF